MSLEEILLKTNTRKTHDFVYNLWKIVNDKYNEIVEWSKNGCTFYVNYSLLDDFLAKPNYFRIKNKFAFIKLLDLYGMYKISHDCSKALMFEYSNINFQRDREDLLENIIPKYTHSGPEVLRRRDPCKKKITNKISRLTWARQKLRLTLAIQHLSRNKGFYMEIENMKKSAQANLESVATFYENPLDSVSKVTEYDNERENISLESFYEDMINLNNRQETVTTIVAEPIENLLRVTTNHFSNTNFEPVKEDETVIFTFHTNQTVGTELITENNIILEESIHVNSYSVDMEKTVDDLKDDKYFEITNESAPLDYSLASVVPIEYETRHSANISTTTPLPSFQEIFSTEPLNYETNAYDSSLPNQVFSHSEFDNFQINEVDFPPDYFNQDTVQHVENAIENFFIQIRESMDILNENDLI